MEGPPPPAPFDVDLLIVGGLTVDVFPDGATRPGGSVLHATRAATAAGLRVGVVTAAGPEPAAQDGLHELERRAHVRAQAVPRSIAFGHEQGPTGTRRLVVLEPGTPLAVASPELRPTAVLYAPVAGELGPELGGLTVRGARTGAILQGWLRPTQAGRPVPPGSMAVLGRDLAERLATLDMVCVSAEDLSGEAVPPAALVDRLRAWLGAGPVLALTDGSRGAWIDDAHGRALVAPPEVVPGPALGAGDAFAALLLTGLAAGRSPQPAAEDAALEVVRFLRRQAHRRLVIGDVHGARNRLVQLLIEHGLVNEQEGWTGGTAELWLLGDLLDRGPDGIGVVELVMRLQPEAAAAGGRVESVLGNHEVAILAAHLMPDAPTTGPGRTFRRDWLANGGREPDLGRLTQPVVDWLRARPAMALLDGDLLVHADATIHADLGHDVPAVNEAMAAILAQPDPPAWDRLLARFSERMAFADPDLLTAFLQRFGATRLIHGHTPVPAMIDGDPADAERPLRYASGRAVAADPGLYLGGPGFIVEL